MIDSTLKGSTANSYVSTTEAINYFSDRPYGFTFSDEDMFSPCLVHATQIIDRYIEWFGERTTEEQSLEWPRKNIGVDEDEIPYDIKMATYELALSINESNILSSNSISDFDSIKVSSISLNMSGKISSGVIPVHIKPLLEKYGHVSGINCDLLRK